MILCTELDKNKSAVYDIEYRSRQAKSAKQSSIQNNKPRTKQLHIILSAELESVNQAAHNLMYRRRQNIHVLKMMCTTLDKDN